jgi:methionine sulfoxide reductase heme-binding subunit
MNERSDGPAAQRDPETKGTRSSYWTRRAGRNLGIAGVATVVTILVFTLATDKHSWAFRASMATAYSSVVLMAWALVIGPWRVMRGGPAVTSVDLRRDVGIWSAGLAVAHVVTGLQVHMGGDMLRYFIYRPPEPAPAIPIRIDPFGITNWTGLVATLVLVFLVMISNDRSLRSLGASRWKRLQSLTYVAAVLTALHGIVFQLMDRRSLPFIGAFLALVVTVLALQLRGRRLVRMRSQNQRE